jgi:hypothetical protein
MDRIIVAAPCSDCAAAEPVLHACKNMLRVMVGEKDDEMLAKRKQSAALARLRADRAACV